MKVDFKNIGDFVIQLSDFELNWRFTGPEYNVLPNYHLELLKPLEKKLQNFYMII